MKKLLFLSVFTLLCLVATAQTSHPNFVPQTWFNTPAYSGGVGGYKTLLLNNTTSRMETTPNTYLQGSVIGVVESDSARLYNFTGSYICNIKYSTRDTIRLNSVLYTAGQVFKFIVTAAVSDTTIFVPTAGNVQAAASYSVTGTNNSVSLYYDGTNYWVTK